MDRDAILKLAESICNILYGIKKDTVNTGVIVLSEAVTNAWIYLQNRRNVTYVDYIHIILKEIYVFVLKLEGSSSFKLNFSSVDNISSKCILYTERLNMYKSTSDLEHTEEEPPRYIESYLPTYFKS